MSDTETTPTQTDAVSTEEYQKVQLGPKTVELPADWDIGRVGDNTYLKGRIGWHGLTEEDHLEEGDYFLVTGTDFENGRVNWDECVYVNQEWYERDENIQLEEGDILLTKDGSIGKTALIEDLPHEGTLNNGIFLIRPLEEAYLPEFMYYVLNSKYMDDFIESITAGSTISHLYQKDFVNFRFPLPPLPEQRRIAAVLSTVDEEIRQTEEIIETTEELKRGLRQDLVTDGIEHQEYQETKLGPKMVEIPQSWDVEKVGEVSEVVTGSTPDTDNEEFYGGDIAWVTPTDITSTEGAYLHETERKLTQEGLDSCSATLMEPGAVLVTTRATIGATAINTVPAATNQGFKSLVPGDRLHAEYLYYYINSIRGYLEALGGGSTFPEVNKRDMTNLRVPVPPIEEQREIADVISAAGEKESREKDRLNELQELKRALMQDLLTGEVRTPTDLLD